MWAVIIFFLLFGVLFALPKTENKPSSSTRIEVETSSPPAGTKLETPSLNSNDLRIMQTAEIGTHPSPFLDEDFSDERLVNDNWQFAADVDNLKQADISDGKLMMGVSNDTQILYMPITYSDVVIQVDITRISGKGYAGLVCRFEEIYFEYFSLYYFLLSENGTPSFIYNDAYKEEGVGFPAMNGLLFPDAVELSLSENSTNTLMVVCRGNTFSAYINDRLIYFAEVDMKYISPGYVGVMVVSEEESEYSFDNFSISKP